MLNPHDSQNPMIKRESDKTYDERILAQGWVDSICGQIGVIPVTVRVGEWATEGGRDAQEVQRSGVTGGPHGGGRERKAWQEREEARGVGGGGLVDAMEMARQCGRERGHR